MSVYYYYLNAKNYTTMAVPATADAAGNLRLGSNACALSKTAAITLKALLNPSTLLHTYTGTHIVISDTHPITHVFSGPQPEGTTMILTMCLFLVLTYST